MRTSVEVSRSQPAAGRGCLVIRAEAVDPAVAPVVVETPPVWITTPPIQAPSGKLLQIEAQVWVPQGVKGSVDGLLVFDSLGGPALAERVGPAAPWRRLVLYRIVPADADGEPLTVTFALTGMGEVRIDNVSVRVLDRGGPGVPVSIVSTGNAAAGNQPGFRAPGFPAPGELLGSGNAAVSDGPVNLPLPTGPATAAASPSGSGLQWPGKSLEWPKILPFGQSNVPPPGPGGGRIDPFKQAGMGVSQPSPAAAIDPTAVNPTAVNPTVVNPGVDPLPESVPDGDQADPAALR